MSTPRFLDLPAGVRRARVHTASGHLAALAAEPSGGEHAPVVLVPGITGSKEDFLPILPRIAGAGHPVVAIDQRGQYESPGGDDPSLYDITQLADDVLAVVAAAGQPAHLVGHSFGGLVVRAAALADPASVRSLALMASGPAAVPHPASSNLALLAQALPAMDLETIWTIKRDMERTSRPPLPTEIESFLERRFLSNNPASLLRMAEQLLTEADCVDELAELDLPMIVLFGAGDDAWPADVQREMAQRLGAATAEIPESGHSPAVDNPDGTSEVLLRFWRTSSGV